MSGEQARGLPRPLGRAMPWIVIGLTGYIVFGDEEPGVDGRTSCSYVGAPTRVLTVKVEGDFVGEIVRRGDKIDVGEADGTRSTCSGGRPTVRNTDAIKIVLVDVTFVAIDPSGGPFAPGATTESTGASEIEIDIDTDSGGAEVYGTDAADLWHWGPGATRRG